MFIYKITIIPLSQVYIGLDTNHPYKQARWKTHCKESQNPKNNRKLHVAMNYYGIENCTYEIIQNGFTSLGQLALAEINYIKEYDSYVNGLNSSLGGDGLGHTSWSSLTDLEIAILRETLGQHFRNYNVKKWANTTAEQRREMVKGAFVPDVVARRTASLKEYYKTFPEVLEKKRESMSIMRNQNKEYRDYQARLAGLVGAAKMAKKIKVEFPDGTIVIYASKSEMQRQTGQWAKTLITKTKQGITYNGYKAWDIDTDE